MSCAHGDWIVTDTGSWVCAGCGSNVGLRPMAGEWICEQHPRRGVAARRLSGTGHAGVDRMLAGAH